MADENLSAPWPISMLYVQLSVEKEVRRVLCLQSEILLSTIEGLLQDMKVIKL